MRKSKFATMMMSTVRWKRPFKVMLLCFVIQLRTENSACAEDRGSIGLIIFRSASSVPHAGEPVVISLCSTITN